MAKSDDSAGVWFPPPLIFLGFLLIGLGAERWLHWGSFGMEPTLRLMAGGLLTLCGIAIEGMAALGFRRAKTSLPPWQPATTIVVSGLHAVTRNPMYVGMAVTQAGIAVLFNNLLALILTAASVLCVRLFVIAKEEVYLERKFGDSYRAYKARVPRWI